MRSGAVEGGQDLCAVSGPRGLYDVTTPGYQCRPWAWCTVAPWGPGWEGSATLPCERLLPVPTSLPPPESQGRPPRGAPTRSHWR